MSSREYTKFKKSFIGPILPRKIAKSLQLGIFSGEMKADKPKKHVSRKESNPPCNFDDWRSSRHGLNVTRLVTPNWANKNEIKELYEESKRLTKETGIKHHVDHIIPLRHPLVCGLHIRANLRIITATENIIKSNDFII
jgi:hypothetical protein